MITSLRLVNFKNFADETLRVGPFTVIVGANASGKSNIRDAFRFLHGIGRGYTLAEILGEKYGDGGQLEWGGIRGAMNEIIRFEQSEFALEVELKPTTEFVSAAVKNISYFIRIHRNDKNGGRFRVTAESLTSDSEILYKSVPAAEIAMGAQEKDSKSRLCLQTPDKKIIEVASDRPGFRQLARHLVKQLDNAEWTNLTPAAASIVKCLEIVMGALRQIRFLELVPERMRAPSFPGATPLGDSGENLPTALEAICDESERKNVLTSWLQELTPMDVRDFEFPRDPSGRVHLQIVEKNGRKVSAYSASDGTLRFLAMLTALLGENPAGLYFFEEIDNGIHPVRLHLLADLLERQTAKNGVQVITTTHAPTLLTVINDNTFENTSVVCRMEDTQDAIIRPVTKLHNVRELRQDQGLGRLHESGWMEDALFFTEGYDEAEEES